MDIATLVILGLLLIVVLGFLLFLFLKARNVKKAKAHTQTQTPSKPIQETPPLTMENLINIIKDKTSNKSELTNALDMILKHYGKINQKQAQNEQYAFRVYEKILIAICKHPNTDKDIILHFNRELEKYNPSYKKEINDAITRGLNARR